MPILVSLQKIAPKNHLPSIWKQTPQTKISKWIICLKISLFPQSQKEGGNTYMPLGSPLGKKILSTCNIFSRKSIICLVIRFYCSGIKKEKKISTQILEHYTEFILKKKSKNVFFFFISEPDGKNKQMYSILRKETHENFQKKFSQVFFFFIKQHGKKWGGDDKWTNRLWF